MSIEAQDVIASDLPDLSDLTLAEGAGIDDEEYARIMRRVHGGGRCCAAFPGAGGRPGSA